MRGFVGVGVCVFSLAYFDQITSSHEAIYHEVRGKC